MLARSAWDFYFDRTGRELLLERLRWRGTCPAEEVWYKDSNGRPMRLLVSHSLAGAADGQPQLILSTAIEVMTQSDPRLAEPKHSTSTAEDPTADGNPMMDVSQRLTHLLHRASEVLDEDNLPKMNKAEIREVLLVLEEIKMLMSELEILLLPPM